MDGEDSSRLGKYPTYYLMGDIEYTTAGGFVIEERRAWVNEAKHMNLVIASHGGMTDSTLLVIDTIRRMQAAGITVSASVLGYAEYGAFWIMQACRPRYMSRYGMLATAGVNLADVQKTQEGGGFLRTTKEEEHPLAPKVKFVNELFKELLEGAMLPDTIRYKLFTAKERLPVYFTAEQALEYALVDEVIAC